MRRVNQAGSIGVFVIVGARYSEKRLKIKEKELETDIITGFRPLLGKRD